MTIARDLATRSSSSDLVRTDLYMADEVFFTGTAAEITPIREVDDRTVGDGHRGPVTKELQDAFFAATKGDDPELRGLAHLRRRLSDPLTTGSAPPAPDRCAPAHPRTLPRAAR